MRFRVLLTFTLLVCFSACSRKSNSSGEQIATSEEEAGALLRIQQADSTWKNKERHDPNFTGMHSHGKDLAVHAHQDVKKQRYILQKGVEVQESREEAFRQQSERRRQELIKRGIIQPDTHSEN